MVDKTLLANLARQKNIEKMILSLTHENRRADMLELLHNYGRIVACNERTRRELANEVRNGKA